MRFYALHFIADLLVVGILVCAATREGQPLSYTNNQESFLSTLASRVLHLVLDPPPYPECRMTVPQIIQHIGYAVEIHEVTTQDGYILELHRIPYGRDGRSSDSHEPILLKHGLTSSSFSFVTDLANQSLGYILADNGYDVWLGNSRGNTYSTKHISLSSQDKEFWDFSFDEIAEFDLPAMIDYILNTTNKSQISYIGHSQGAAEALALFSSTKVYNDKVRMLIALATPTTLANTSVEILTFFAPYTELIKYLLDFIGLYEVLGYTNLFRLVGERVCMHPAVAEKCLEILRNSTLRTNQQLNTMRLPIYITHGADVTSFRSIVHFSQIMKRKAFSHYDHGFRENWKKYKQIEPRVYDLKQVDIPTVMISGSEDNIASRIDIKESAKELPNLIELIEVKGCTHLGFILYAGDDLPVVGEVLRLLKKVI